MTVGMARVTEFQEIRPGAGFKTGDFVKEMFGRLPYNDSRARVTPAAARIGPKKQHNPPTVAWVVKTCIELLRRGALEKKSVANSTV